MELTKEMKARFFALYWGQNRAYNDELNLRHVSERYIISDIIRHPERLNKAYLLLKPLASISDEDAIEAARIAYPTLPDNDPRLENWGRLFVADNFNYLKCTHNVDVLLRAYQYLQSKGYALPFMGISVEQMIEAGWIKLTVN